MKTARWLTSGLFGLAAVALLAGCGTNPKDLQIDSLNERIRALESENEDLRNGMNQCMRDRDAARERAFQLQQQNDELRGMLAGGTGEVPEQWQRAGAWTWTDLETDLLFASGRATLRSEAQSSMQRVAEQVNQYFGDQMILVIGHTDNEPINKTKHLWKDNLDLSANRAMTVFHELAKLGISPERMIACGQGEYNPVADNATDAGRQQNRRVQIVAIPKPGAVVVIEDEPAAEAEPARPQDYEK